MNYHYKLSIIILYIYITSIIIKQYKKVGYYMYLICIYTYLYSNMYFYISNYNNS